MTYEEIVALAKEGGPVPKVISDWKKLILENLIHSIQLFRDSAMTKEELNREYVWMEGCYYRIGAVYDRAMQYGRMMPLLGGLSKEAHDTKNELAERIFALLDSFFTDMKTGCDVVEVLRCEDCRHFEIDKDYGNHTCWFYGESVRRDDYCSRGKRKEEP